MAKIPFKRLRAGSYEARRGKKKVGTIRHSKTWGTWEIRSKGKALGAPTYAQAKSLLRSLFTGERGGWE